MNRKFLILMVLLCLLVITPILAADTPVAIKAGTTTKDATSIIMDKGSVTFTATDTKLAATTTTLIDGKLFLPETTTENPTSLAWETTDAKMEYTYTGRTLKETITLKEDKQLSFPITLAKDSKLIPWDGGQWKIVSSVTGNTMTGVILEKPYGIDAKGNRIEMVYTYKDGVLNLEYNREAITYKINNGTYPNGTPYEILVSTSSEIAYPLVIDPTWVSVSGRWEDSTTIAGYTLVMWNVTGNDTWTPPYGVTQVEYVVVGGGGEGASQAYGSGGGAGAFRNGTLSVILGTVYSVGVGAGGDSVNLTPGVNGSSSQFGSITSLGGGGGGNPHGQDGGSGGGASYGRIGLALNPLYGNNGGNGTWAGASSGGGGGAGGAGKGGTYSGEAGMGGMCIANNLTGVPTFYASGGGGSCSVNYTGTCGIGGNGSDYGARKATKGKAATGSGGGGGALAAGNQGESGGSGIVIIKYLTYTQFGVSPSISNIYATNVTAILLPPLNQPMNWTFGDTYTSQTNNFTSHLYSVAGNYTINLSVTNTSDPGGFQNFTTTFNLTSDTDSNLKSWMHMNGADGGTTFTDIMGSAWTPNSVTTETAIKKFGTASALFNANGDELVTPSSAAFDFGTGNFTIEQWVYPTSSGIDEFILSRTTNGATKADGWGIYHSTAAVDSGGWVMYLGTTAVQTGTFTLPLNTWSHLAIQRSEGVVNVSVDGVRVAGVTAAGNYDTANAISYGDTVVGGSGAKSAKMYLDETRISKTLRWKDGGAGFSPPYAEYVGDLFPTVININPNSTLRFKTNPSATPPGNALISNLTMRNRTIQIQNVTIAANLSTVVIFNPEHVRAINIYANNTHFTGVNITNRIIDNTAGTVLVNATRPGGFSTTALTESRGSVFDIQMLYWNYTPPATSSVWDDSDVLNRQFFGSGYLKNGTSGFDFPVVNFYPTNVSFIDWITLSNFTASDTTPDAAETNVTFATVNNVTANRFIWNFGDGTKQNSTNGLAYHIYSLPGIYSVSSQAYLWQNNTVSNYTLLEGTINATYKPTYVGANFVGTPTLGNIGSSVSFTDLTIWANATTTGRIYNWSFGDGYYSSTVGDVNHVYGYYGLFTVRLIVNNTANLTLGSDSETKVDYISISTEDTNAKLNVLYPHEVQFTLVDTKGSPLSNVDVAVVAYNSTIETTNWLFTLFGISGEATPIVGTSLYGVTDSDGGVVFPLVSSASYIMAFNSTTLGISETKTIHPQQSNYIIVLHPTASLVLNMNNYINGTLYPQMIDDLHVSLNLLYADSSSSTTSLMFFVDTANRTRVNTTVFSSPLSITTSAIVNNIAADGYVWGYYANTTLFGNVSESQGIVMKGASGRLINIDPCNGYARGWGNEC